MKRPILLDSFPVWLYYPSLIKWKINNRNILEKSEKGFLINTINASILIDLTTFLEGIVYEMQTEIFFDRFDHKNNFENSLFEHFDKKLNNATWTNYIEYFEIILGEKLINKIESDNWKCISLLFNYRNSLVHGKEIEVHYYENNNDLNAESPNNFKSIFLYLKEMKLIDLSFEPYLNTVNLLNNNVVDHFFNHTVIFIENLFAILPESEIADLKNNYNECLQF